MKPKYSVPTKETDLLECAELAHMGYDRAVALLGVIPQTVLDGWYFLATEMPENAMGYAPLRAGTCLILLEEDRERQESDQLTLEGIQ